MAKECCTMQGVVVGHHYRVHAPEEVAGDDVDLVYMSSILL